MRLLLRPSTRAYRGLLDFAFGSPCLVVGHVTYNRLQLNSWGLAQAKLCLPLVAVGVGSPVGEARALGLFPVPWREKAKPLLATMRTWLDGVLPTVPPESLTGKALIYLYNQWSKLIRYLEDGRLSMDNNAVENAIRPFVLGRKAWLFSDTVAGANASANLYGLIETAKANNHEPYYYLRHLFTELPKAKSLADIETLLPFNLKPAQISRSPP